MTCYFIYTITHPLRFITQKLFGIQRQLIFFETISYNLGCHITGIYLFKHIYYFDKVRFLCKDFYIYFIILFGGFFCCCQSHFGDFQN